MNKKTILEYAVGPVLSMLLGLISIPLIAWFFPQEAVAANALVLTLVTLLSMVCSLGLDSYYVREFHEQEPNQLFWFALCTSIVFTLLCLVVIQFAVPFTISVWLFGEQDSLLDGLFWAAIFTSTYNRFPLSVLRMNDQSLRFSLGQALQKVFFVSLVVVCAFSGLTDDKALVIATLIAYLVVGLYLTVQTRPYLTKAKPLTFNLVQTRQALSYGVPLIIAGISAWAMTSTDRFMLDYFSTREQLAIYSLAFNFATVASIVQVVFINVWSPHVFKAVKEGRDKDLYQNVLDKMTAVIIVMISLFGAGSWLLNYLLPQSYHQVSAIVVLCATMPLIATLSTLTGVAIQVSKKTYLTTLCTLAALIANIALNVPLISQFGAAGAAVASAVSQLFYFVLNSQLAKREGASIRVSRCYTLISAVTVLATLHACSPYPVVLSSVVWLVLIVAIAIWYKRDLLTLTSQVLARIPTEKPRH